MVTDRREKEKSWLSLLDLRARISLFALVWTGHEQAREERCIVGSKGWMDMMHKSRIGESKTGDRNVIGKERRQSSRFKSSCCFELAVLQAEAVASLCGGIPVFGVLHSQTYVKLQLLFYFKIKEPLAGTVVLKEQSSEHITHKTSETSAHQG